MTDWKEFTTNQTVNYRKHWGEWEAIREIMQNSLDETDQLPELIIDKKNNRTIIQDTGHGITLNQLILLGKTGKDGEDSRGKFGEGIKIALIVLTRMGYKVRLYSRQGFEAETFAKPFGEDYIFALKYREVDLSHFTSGTKILIEGFIPSADWSKRLIREIRKFFILKRKRIILMERLAKAIFLRKIALIGLFMSRTYSSSIETICYGLMIFGMSNLKNQEIAPMTLA